MPKDDVEFYVKLRDAAALILDACNDKLEGMAPSGGSAARAYDIGKIAWQKAEGPKGVYMKTEGDNTPDYQALVKDLQAHKGKMNIGGAFYWLFENQTTIGRTVKQ